MKSTIAVGILAAAFATFAANGSATALYTVVPTPAGIERYLLHPPDRGGLLIAVPGGVKVGPVLAAACRAEGAVERYVGSQAYYSRFICAVRARNADRLAILRVLTPSKGAGNGFFKYHFLGWR